MRRRGCEVCRKSVVRGVMSKSFVGLLCPVDRKTERPAPMTTRSKYLEQVARAQLERSGVGFAGNKMIGDLRRVRLLLDEVHAC